MTQPDIDRGVYCLTAINLDTSIDRSRASLDIDVFFFQSCGAIPYDGIPSTEHSSLYPFAGPA
jgi:hypothetical protein